MVMKVVKKPGMEMSSMPYGQSVEAKQINVSEKRQITIPKRFYDKLGIGTEIICELRGDEIVLRHVPQAADFSAEILKDLVSEGFEGDSLLHEFQKRKSQIRPAVENLIAESRLAADKMNGDGDDQTSELFGDVKE